MTGRHRDRGPPAGRAHVGGVGGDLVRDHALPHIFGVGQAQVLLGCDIASMSAPSIRSWRPQWRSRNVVVARRDVDDEGAERIERRIVADLLHPANIHLDLLHRDVSGPFNHDLDVARPGSPRQLAQCVELGELGASLASCRHPGRSESPNEMVTSYWRRISSTSSKRSYSGFCLR